MPYTLFHVFYVVRVGSKICPWTNSWVNIKCLVHQTVFNSLCKLINNSCTEQDMLAIITILMIWCERLINKPDVEYNRFQTCSEFNLIEPSLNLNRITKLKLICKFYTIYFEAEQTQIKPVKTQSQTSQPILFSPSKTCFDKTPLTNVDPSEPILNQNMNCVCTSN